MNYKPRSRETLTPNVTFIVLVVGLLSIGLSSGAQPGNAPGKGAHALPQPFNSVLPELKAKSQVPLLLPSELKPVADAHHAILETAEKDSYAISLYYKLGIGDAGFAASFSGEKHADYGPRDLANVSPIQLAHGITGYFRPVSCGGSCAPANLWWEEDGVLYNVQIELPSTLAETQQQRELEALVNSAILAGPR